MSNVGKTGVRRLREETGQARYTSSLPQATLWRDSRTSPLYSVGKSGRGGYGWSRLPSSGAPDWTKSRGVIFFPPRQPSSVHYDRQARLWVGRHRAEDHRFPLFLLHC